MSPAQTRSSGGPPLPPAPAAGRRDAKGRGPARSHHGNTHTNAHPDRPPKPAHRPRPAKSRAGHQKRAIPRRRRPRRGVPVNGSARGSAPPLPARPAPNISRLPSPSPRPARTVTTPPWHHRNRQHQGRQGRRSRGPPPRPRRRPHPGHRGVSPVSPVSLAHARTAPAPEFREFWEPHTRATRPAPRPSPRKSPMIFGASRGTAVFTA